MTTCTVSGQEALLLWCKLNTCGYQDVKVQNFHSSWRDGLALCALIHKFHPEILQFESLSKDKPLDNLDVAFSLADKLGVPRLLDPLDMLIEPRPDQRSVATYLSQMYHVFERNDHPGKGIAGDSLGQLKYTNENSSEFENNLIQEQVSAKPKLTRSVSTSMLPKHTPGSPSSNLSLQKRAGPPLLTKGSVPKFTPPSKTVTSPPTSPVAASVPTLAAAPVPSPTPAPASPVVIPKSIAPDVFPSPSPSPCPSPLPSPSPSPIPFATSPVPIPRKSVSSSAIELPSSASNSASYKLSSVPAVSSSAPVSFPRSVANPSISIASLLTISPKNSDPKTDEQIAPSQRLNSTRSPSSGASPTHSPSPSPTPPSPSPSPTPQDSKKLKVKVLGTKSAPSHLVKGDESDEEKIIPKITSPPLQSKSSESQKLKRTFSGSWVAKYKENNSFISVEMKKVKELEGPLQDGSDDENSKPRPPASKSFMVDKVSSSSREGWLAKRQAQQEEDDGDYEYIDNDPNRIHEPPNLLANFKLETCLLRSSSTGKLAMPSTLNRDRSLKKVSFKETYMPSIETILEEPKLMQVEVQEVHLKDKEPHSKLSDTQEKERDLQLVGSNSKEGHIKDPGSPTTREIGVNASEGISKKAPNAHPPVLSVHVPTSVPHSTVPGSTPAPGPTLAPAPTLAPGPTPAPGSTPTPGLAPAAMKELERERDAAIFHRDEIAAKYAELEVKLKEEKAANDAMERETAELHQKLATVQEQMEAKLEQKLAEMTQKLADKDREILRLRMQNTMNKKKVEEKERDLERLKNTRSFSPPPEIAEDLEADNECRKTWENAEKETPTKPVIQSYAGLKISYSWSTIIYQVFDSCLDIV